MVAYDPYKWVGDKYNIVTATHKPVGGDVLDAPHAAVHAPPFNP